MPDENLKHLGVISIAVAFSALMFIVWRWPLGTRASSISKHAGAQRTSYLLFGGVLTFVGAPFCLFLWRWFGPAIGAAWPYYLILVYQSAYIASFYLIFCSLLMHVEDTVMVSLAT